MKTPTLREAVEALIHALTPATLPFDANSEAGRAIALGERALAAAGDPRRCRRHPEVKLRCPACAAARSARQPRSEAQLTASRANMELAQAAVRKYSRCARYGSHRFSPVTGRCPCGEMRPGSAE